MYGLNSNEIVNFRIILHPFINSNSFHANQCFSAVCMALVCRDILLSLQSFLPMLENMYPCTASQITSGFMGTAYYSLNIFWIVNGIDRIYLFSDMIKLMVAIHL